VEENWDSDEEEEDRAVAAAEVLREEEKEPGGSDPWAPGIGLFVLMAGVCVLCVCMCVCFPSLFFFSLSYLLFY